MEREAEKWVGVKRWLRTEEAGEGGEAGEPQKGTVPRPKRTSLGPWLVVSFLNLSICVHACVCVCVRPSVCVTVRSGRHLRDTQGLKEMDQKGSGQVVTEQQLGWIRKRDRMRLEGEGLGKLGWR